MPSLSGAIRLNAVAPSAPRGNAADVLPLLAVVAAGLACAWPIFRNGYPAGSWDVRFHFLYAEEFLRELRGGTLLPRWLPGLDGGLGAPTFYYYGLVPYYVTSLAGLLTGRSDGLFLLGAAAVTMIVGSGLSTYAWLRIWVGPWPAAAGAALYMALPYHLLMDFWTRSAFAEATAYVWLPLVFRGVEDARAGRRTALVLPLALALLIATHIITALLTCLVLAPYAALRVRSQAAWLRVLLGAGAGVALSALYLLPAVLMRDQVFYPAPVLDDSVFLLDHLRHGHTPARAIAMAIDLIGVSLFACAAALLGGIAWLGVRRGPLEGGVVWGALTLGVIAAATTWLAPVWRAVPLLANVQFPSRLLALADLGTATTAAILLAGLTHHVPRLRKLPGICVAGAGLLGALLAIPALAFSDFDASKAPWGRITAIRSIYETFRPINSHERLPFDRDPDARPEIPAVAVLGSGSAAVAKWSAGHIVITTDLRGPATVEIGQLYFGRWRARDEVGELPVAPSAEYGLVDVQVPAGRDQVSLDLVPGFPERAGLLVSLMAALGWAAVAIAGPIQERRTRSARPNGAERAARSQRIGDAADAPHRHETLGSG
jgi:hypothetical protein